MLAAANRHHVRLLLSIAATAACASSALAVPPWWDATNKRGFMPDIADYFQHQKWGSDNTVPGVDSQWEFLNAGFGGWCFQVAMADCMYKLEKDLHDTLPNGALAVPWVATMNAKLKELATDMIVAPAKEFDDILPRTVSYQYVQWDAGKPKILFTNNRFLNAPGAHASIFDFTVNEFLHDSAIMLVMKPDVPRTVKPWWSNFHAVAIAGMDDGATKKVYFADPDVNGGNTDDLAIFKPLVRSIADNASYMQVQRQRFLANAPLPVPTPNATVGLPPANWDRYYNLATIDSYVDGGNTRMKLRQATAGDTRFDKMLWDNLFFMRGSIFFLDPPVPLPLGREQQRAVCSMSTHGRADYFMIFPQASVDLSVPPTLEGPGFTGWAVGAYRPYTDVWGNSWPYGVIIAQRVSGSPLGPSSSLAAVHYTTLSHPSAHALFWRDFDNPTKWLTETQAPYLINDVVQFAQQSPPGGCIGDFNQDGGIDGSDVQDFFAAWSQGDPSADVNQDGGVDGSDVVTFFDAWEQGSC